MAQQHGHESVHHIVPFPLLAKVAGGLFVLTFLTMIAFWNHQYLGAFAAPIAFLIAAVKAGLVMTVFMGMKWDTWMNRSIFGIGFFFLLVLFGFCAIDIWTRVPQMTTLQ
jgi:cytochrome c oxidase subunit 4